MEGDRSMADATNRPSAASAPVSIPKVCYVGSASLIDAMFDQLEYLVAHVSTKCSPGCLECERLEQVKNWLLAPFRSAPEDPTRQESER